jgi:glycosyltransferase involved in cell wall biosynthesis
MKIALLTTDNREHYKTYDQPEPCFGTAPEALLQGLAQLHEAEVHVVSCLRERVKSPAKIGPNIFYHSLHVSKIGWIRTAYQGCVRATRRKLNEIQPDIVHGQGTEHDCAISAVLSGFPNVLTIHGNMRFIAKVNRVKPLSFFWLAARLEKLTVPRSAGVVCITRYTQDAVSDLARKTWVLPNAVDASFFEVEANPPPETPPRILCVGLICMRKNQNAFIRALDPVAKKHKFELLFLGLVYPGRPYDDEFLALVKARPWCRHLGFADREALKTHFREASLLALPSLEDNCPMAVLEAMAAGVPVVAAKVGGVPELIEENQTGIFCDPLDTASMANAIERALSNPGTTAMMAKKAHTLAHTRFHPKVIAQNHLEIYREVLASNSSGLKEA